MHPDNVAIGADGSACSRATMGRVGAVVLLLSTAVTHADLTTGFSSRRALPPAPATGVGTVALDGPSYDAYEENPTHLLLLDDSSSNAVPFLVRAVSPMEVPTTEDPVPMTVLSWVTQAEGRVEIVLEMRDLTQSPNRFRIGKESMSFHVSSSLESSLDCAEWSLLASTQNLFRVADTPLAQAGLTFETHGAFFFKLSLAQPCTNEQAQLAAIFNGAMGCATNLGLDSNDLQFVEVQHNQGAARGIAADLPRILTPSTNVNSDSNVFIFTSDRLPIRRFDVDANSTTTHLPVRVLSRNGPDAEWVEIARQELYQFQLADQPFRAMTVTLDNPRRFSEYRFELGTPAGPIGVKASGPGVWLQFSCEAHHSYHLYQDGSSTTVVAVAGMLDGAEVPLSLGVQEANPSFGQPEQLPVPVVVPAQPAVVTQPVANPPPTLNERGRHQLLEVTLGLMAACWLWFLGRLFKGNRS